MFLVRNAFPIPGNHYIYKSKKSFKDKYAKNKAKFEKKAKLPPITEAMSEVSSKAGSTRFQLQLYNHVIWNYCGLSKLNQRVLENSFLAAGQLIRGWSPDTIQTFYQTSWRAMSLTLKMKITPAAGLNENIENLDVDHTAKHPHCATLMWSATFKRRDQDLEHNQRYYLWKKAETTTPVKQIKIMTVFTGLPWMGMQC